MRPSALFVWMVSSLFWALANGAWAQQVFKPVEDPCAKWTNAQLIAAMKADPKTTEEYHARDNAGYELFFRGSDPEVRSLLMALLQDPNSHVQTEAARVLSQMGVKEATLTLVSWLGEPSSDSPKHVPEWVMRDLEELQDPAAKPGLIEYMRSDHYTESGKAMVLLAKLGGKELIPTFKSYLTNRMSFLQLDAAEALAILGDSSGHEIARNALRDHPQYLNKRALEALGFFGDAGDLGLLADMEKQSLPKGRGAADFAMVRLQIEMKRKNDHDKIGRFSELFNGTVTSANAESILWAVKQLGAMSDPAAVELLKRTAMSSLTFNIRFDAYKQLARKGVYLAHQKTEPYGYLFSPPAASTAPTAALQGARK